MIIVLDTNVLIAAFIARGQCSEVFLDVSKNHDVVISQYIITEFERTLHKKIKAPSRDVLAASKMIRRRARLQTHIEPLQQAGSRDHTDNPILALAIATNADLLISGDKDLLILKKYQGIPIIQPQQYWEQVKKIS